MCRDHLRTLNFKIVLKTYLIDNKFFIRRSTIVCSEIGTDGHERFVEGCRRGKHFASRKYLLVDGSATGPL